MKITRNQLRSIIKEATAGDELYQALQAYDNWKEDQVARDVMDYDIPEEYMIIKWMSSRQRGNGRKYAHLIAQIADEYGFNKPDVMRGLKMYGSKVLQRNAAKALQGYRRRRIVGESAERGPDFPDLSHPTIAQFADKTYGPTEPMGGTKWFTSMQSYRYKAGGSSDQSITVYHLPDGQYRARIGGSYSNTLSNDRRAGKHPDAISAIEAALDSSPSSTGPTARELLTPVGEKVKSFGYIGQD